MGRSVDDGPSRRGDGPLLLQISLRRGGLAMKIVGSDVKLRNQLSYWLFINLKVAVV
jgi:hypothetical protein